MKKIIPILICLSFAMSICCFASETVTIVNTVDDLQSAIEQAENFGTIYLSESLRITDPISIGSAEKNVLLCAANSISAVIEIESDVSFNNVSICGSSIDCSSLTIHQMSGNATFENVSFLYSYGDTPKSAFKIDNGTASFSNCLFEGGHAENGGFIYIADDASVILADTTLTNGYASNNGGAIYALGDLNVNGGKFFSCVCDGQGAAIWHEKKISFQDCEMFSNYSPDELDIYPELPQEVIEDNSENSDIGDKGTAEAAEDDVENRSLEDNSDDAAKNSLRRRGSYVVRENREIISLNCNGAKIDNDIASELCIALPKYFPGERTVSREEFSGFLFSILSEESKKAMADTVEMHRYVDIEGSAYNGIIKSLTSFGIFSGCGNGLFSPNEPLTWAQMISVFCRFTDPKEAELSSLNLSGHWAESAVKTSIALKWIKDAPVDLQASVTIRDLSFFLSAVAGSTT